MFVDTAALQAIVFDSAAAKGRVDLLCGNPSCRRRIKKEIFRAFVSIKISPLRGEKGNHAKDDVRQGNHPGGLRSSQ